MSTKLNQIECANNYRNVGFGTCVFDPKLIAGAILFPEDRTFTDAEVADMQATLIAAAKADSKTARAYPIHNFEELTDNTEDPVIQTKGYGKKSVVRDGDYDWTFQFSDGALCLLTALQTFNGATPFLFYDKKNRLIGTTKGGKLSTISPQFFHAYPWKPATGDAAAQYILRFVFNAEYINQKLGFADAGFDISEVEGLKDLSLVVNSYDENTGVANITVQTLCNSTNIYSSAYKTALQSSSLWKPYNKETGEEITVSSVAGVDGSRTFNVTISTGDSDYPTAGGTIVWKLAAPSVLSAADIEGFESLETETALSES